MATLREQIMHSLNPNDIANALQGVTVPVHPDRMMEPLEDVILQLNHAISVAPDSAITVASMHQSALASIKSHLGDLKESRASIKKIEQDFAQEIIATQYKIDAVMHNGVLKLEDQQDTIALLCQTITEMRSMYNDDIGTRKDILLQQEEQASAALSRARNLLSHTEVSTMVEGIARADLTHVLEQGWRHKYAHTLLNDGIVVWVSRGNQFATLMTQAMMDITDFCLLVQPTQLCLNPEYVSSIKEKYQLDYVSTDFGELDITIDLRDVEELRYVKRRAVIPEAGDKNSTHYEQPQFRHCVSIKMNGGREYFLADRKNEERGKTWAGLQGTQDGSPSLLYRTLLESWKEAKKDRDN